MKVRILLLLMVGAVLIWAGCTTNDGNGTGPEYVFDGEPIEGELTSLFDWGVDDAFLVQGDLTIPAGETVTIPAGKELRFAYEYDGEGRRIYYKMIVNGKLVAVGNENANIVFTSAEGSVGAGDFGQWRAIIFDDSLHRITNPSDSSLMEYCLIQFGASADTSARYPLADTTFDYTIVGNDTVDIDTTITNDGIFIQGAILCWNSSPIIRNCTLVENGYHAILCYGENASPVIINTNIYQNDGDGVRCDPEEHRGNPDIWFTNSKENNGRQFGDCPEGVGDLIDININRDSCDFHYNIKLEPFFNDFDNQDYSLHACSHLIMAGVDTTTIGSIPYTVGNNELRGLLQKNTPLSAGEWRVSCNAFVEEGDSLKIESGAELVFEGFYNLRIGGVLKADGVNFTPVDPEDPEQWWSGIYFASESDPSSYITNSTFTNASTTMKVDPYVQEDPFGGAIIVDGCSPTISGNTFENCEYTAVSCLNSAQSVVAYNTIDGFGITGIYCYDSSPTIHHNVIHDGEGNGIWCNVSSSPTITDNLIYNTTVNGIKCRNLSSPHIEYLTITGSGYSGVFCDDHSDPTITNTIIALNGSASTWLAGYGNGIKVNNSSSPILSYNDVYQPDGQGDPYGGNVTAGFNSISMDPLFDSNYHVGNDTLLTASSTGGKIGAYGQGNW
ncbi:hypothetical protein CEE37_01200 [candidate division LCP-89 bacterium B3_LCP]|uniref:Right handed beta helix domain-containing protein n=1 Tax=candidate division LCP-89 bacterium B3_LCP TaxID=2012998 RepID=A0A532V546_UNCL8|nr:MAG: hypothetical protein CEE37_01200 [candidate division LCP-89 bacterium B3_LCP]